MAERDYKMIDADTHYYEPEDCFTRFMPPELMHLAITVDVDDEGIETIAWKGQRLDVIEPGFFRKVLKPGSLKEMMQAAKKGLSFAEAGVHAERSPVWTNREARLEAMDEQGLESTLLFPTLGVLWEYQLRDDVEALYANLHAFNMWLQDDWGFNYEDRIYAAPLMSLRDPDLALKELEWAISEGARVVNLKTGHAYGRSPAHPIFDPFWKRAEEAGLVIGFHIGEAGYNEQYSVDFSEPAKPAPNGKSALQWANFFGDRPIMDAFASCIFHNLFGRFPGLRFLSVENGSMWVPYLLATMDKMKGMGRNGQWLGGKFEGRPSDVFRRHIYVSPYPEDDVKELIDVLGPDRVVMGSDFPHPEGTTTPGELAERNEYLGDELLRKFLHDNAYGMLHPTSA